MNSSIINISYESDPSQNAYNTVQLLRQFHAMIDELEPRVHPAMQQKAENLVLHADAICQDRRADLFITCFEGKMALQFKCGEPFIVDKRSRPHLIEMIEKSNTITFMSGNEPEFDDLQGDSIIDCMFQMRLYPRDEVPYGLKY